MSEDRGISLAEIFRRDEGVVGRGVGDEYVLVPIVNRAADLDSIYSLNRVGAFIWEQLDGSTTGDEIVQRILERFEIDETRAVQDYQLFLAQLESIKAVVRGFPKEPGRD